MFNIIQQTSSNNDQRFFGARKEARDGEVDSLKQAKAVLSGADFSFLQASDRKSLRGRRL